MKRAPAPKVPPSFLRPLRKQGDSLRTVYVYADGHATALFQRRDPDTGVYSDYVKHLPPGYVRLREAHGSELARVVLQGDFARVLLGLPGPLELWGRAPEAYNGSEHTKRLGLRVAMFSATSALGSLTWHGLPDLLADDWTLQYGADYAESWEVARNQSTWNDHRVANYLEIRTPYPTTTTTTTTEQ